MQTVRRVYATGGFLDTSSEDRRFERPLIAFEQVIFNCCVCIHYNRVKNIAMMIILE